MSMILHIGTSWYSFLARHPSRSRAIAAAERASARLEDAARKLHRSERLVLQLEQETARLMARAAAQIERAKAVAESIAEDIVDAERSVKQAEQTMEMLRTEHEADATAVETLTARIKEYQALSEANIALSNHRRGQMSPGGIEE